jgi:hypothetical protein
VPQHIPCGWFNVSVGIASSRHVSQVHDLAGSGIGNSSRPAELLEELLLELDEDEEPELREEELLGPTEELLEGLLLELDEGEELELREEELLDGNMLEDDGIAESSSTSSLNEARAHVELTRCRANLGLIRGKTRCRDRPL